MKNGAHWPLFIIGLLVANAGVGLALVLLSSSASPDLVTEDYYAEAARWDETMAQQRANQSLGWTIEAELSLLPSGESEMRLRIQDRGGEAVGGATVEALAFHLGKPKQKYRLRFQPTERGLYLSRLPLTRFGVWELGYEVVRGSENFVSSITTTLERTP